MGQPAISADSTIADLREVVHELTPAALYANLKRLIKSEIVNAPGTMSKVKKETMFTIMMIQVDDCVKMFWGIR